MPPRSEERRVGKEGADWSVTGVQTCALPISVISGQDFSVLPVVNPGSPLFSLTAGKAVRYRGAEPQEDPMRRTLPLCLLVVSCLLSVAEAGQANRCRRDRKSVV